MGIDDSDTHVEAVEEETDRPAPVTQPDRPGVDGYPSRADSRKGAAAANDAIAASDRDGGRKGIVGDGPSDDVARVADHDDGEAERGILASLKRAFTSERVDDSEELAGVVDRPDFQDPREDPRLVPDRYDTPLERTDGTRTPLFRGEPTREQTKQGDLGDCGIIATLGAVAGHRPEAIRDCVRETDDGNYEVRLHEARYSMSRMRYEPTGRPVTLTVTPDLPVHGDEPHKPAFADSTSTGAAWAPVLEKAIAGIDQTWNDDRRRKWDDRWQVQGTGKDAPKGYVRLDQGSNPSDRAELLTQLTGRPAKTYEFPTDYDRNGRNPDQQLLDEFRQQLDDRKPVLVGTRSTGRMMAVTEIYLKHGRQRNTTIGSFGVISVDAREDHPLTVRLGVVTEEEHRYTIHPGDTFPVGDQTWKLDRVEDPTGRDWTVVLTKVE